MSQKNNKKCLKGFTKYIAATSRKQRSEYLNSLTKQMEKHQEIFFNGRDFECICGNTDFNNEDKVILVSYYEVVQTVVEYYALNILTSNSSTGAYISFRVTNRCMKRKNYNKDFIIDQLSNYDSDTESDGESDDESDDHN